MAHICKKDMDECNCEYHSAFKRQLCDYTIVDDTEEIDKEDGDDDEDHFDHENPVDGEDDKKELSGTYHKVVVDSHYSDKEGDGADDEDHYSEDFDHGSCDREDWEDDFYMTDTSHDEEGVGDGEDHFDHENPVDGEEQGDTRGADSDGEDTSHDGEGVGDGDYSKDYGNPEVGADDTAGILGQMTYLNYREKIDTRDPEKGTDEEDEDPDNGKEIIEDRDKKEDPDNGKEIIEDRDKKVNTEERKKNCGYKGCRRFHDRRFYGRGYTACRRFQPYDRRFHGFPWERGGDDDGSTAYRIHGGGHDGSRRFHGFPWEQTI